VVTARKLHDHGITTVSQVARLAERRLVAMLGRASGRHLHALAHNRDLRPVEVRRRRRSMGAQRAVGWGPKTPEGLDATLVGLVDRLGQRLRKAHRVCRTIVLRLRFDDLSRATRSHTLWEATSRTRTVLAAARGLLAAATPMIRSRGCTLVGVTLTNLAPDDAIQLALPFGRCRGGSLDATLDAVKERFGSDAITRAVLLGKRQGLTVPLLPD
jgi:DNA polymerase-4